MGRRRNVVVVAVVTLAVAWSLTAGLAALAAFHFLSGFVQGRSPAVPGVDSPGAARSVAPSTSTAGQIERLLTVVRVVPRRPQVPGYERECSSGQGCVFGPEWTDDTQASLGRNGCDTRNDVLARSLSDVSFSSESPSCDVTGGVLTDPYTGDVLDYAIDGSQIHVDHLFPLAAAWDLGAATWSQERRETFANDPLTELVATSASANLSKADSTPASWLPPRKAFRCEYVLRYLQAAASYDLALTAADTEVIGFVVRRGC